MRIESGLFDHMVLQRNRKQASEADFSGTAQASGRLTASVRQGRQVLAGFSDLALGSVVRGRFCACLKGIPAGGPYTIELKVKDTHGGVLEALAVDDILVGDVWLMGGQSNMQGVGLLKHGPKAEPLVRAFYMDDRWAPAREPIHNMWLTVDQVHIDFCGGVRPGKATLWGVSPATAFGQKMRQLTGVPQGLIACAHGGTSMAQWDPKLKKLGGKSLYGAMMRRFRKNGSKVAGLVWYQGCSDANATAAPIFLEKMRKFLAALRHDCGDARLPAVMVQISRVVGWGADAGVWWNVVQDAQRRLPEIVRNCATVPAIDLALDDIIHVSGQDQVRLGRRLAEAMEALRGNRKAGRPPIALKAIRLEREEHGFGCVVVEFANVQGSLRAGGRPLGFALSGPNPGPAIYDVALARNRAILRCTCPLEELAAMSVHYGKGTDPSCNVTDEADRSLPVFGPIPIHAKGISFPLTAFVRNLRVSPFLPSAGKLEALGYPRSLDGLGLTPRAFPADFCSLREEITKLGAGDRLVYLACAFECDVPMSLLAMLGYDGPVKLWVDGKHLFHDPAGTNPAAPTDAKVAFQAAKGKHELLVALGTHSGAAWGIFLRLGRRDVPRRLVLRGPGAYVMPKILG